MEALQISSSSNNSVELQKLSKWMSSSRFSTIRRPYTAAHVLQLRPTVDTVSPGVPMAKIFWNLLHQCEMDGTFSSTFGALDPVQVAQMAPYCTSIYASGWQCSSTASTTNEPGPDFADYPYDTVPQKVDQLFRAQVLHDRKQRFENPKQKVDFMRPIIGDGDTGHGGLTSVMKMMKLFIEAGAAGVHIEDQKPGAKKCGHMGGKVLVSTQEHVDRLSASRLMADIMGAETILIARTDAFSATLLDSNIDPRDHPYILGCTNPQLLPANEWAPQYSSLSNDERIAKWVEMAKLRTYPETVADFLKTKGNKVAIDRWATLSPTISHSQARKLAGELGAGSVFFDWEGPRTREGYYRIRGGNDMCIARARAFSPNSDMIWVETSTPSLGQAKYLSYGIKQAYPQQYLCYNLSPSFNWDAAGMSDRQMKSFQTDLSELGYVWQFITLAGFHLSGLHATLVARAFAADGVLGYVRTVQRAERTHKVDLLKHQKWSGADLVDAMLMRATGGFATTRSQQAGSTENQFNSQLSKL